MVRKKGVKPHKFAIDHHTRKPHLKNVSKIRQRHQCALCSKLFSVHKSLMRHITTVHQEEAVIEKTAKHQCLTCNRSFSRKDVLARHQKYQHSGDKEHCWFCGHTVTTRVLRGHLRSQACRAMQAIQAREDAAKIQSIRTSAATFSTEVVLDPLVVSIQCYSCSGYVRTGRGRCDWCTDHNYRPKDLQNSLCPTYWELRGLTMRSIHQALFNPTDIGSCALAGAILIACLLDFQMGLNESAALYRRILGSAWTPERFQKDQARIRSIVISAFETIDDMHKGSTCCQKISWGPGQDDVVMIVDVFGVIVMSEATSKHMTESCGLLTYPNIGLARDYVTQRGN